MFGIDEIYEELLMEAKSPEEIKKILEFQFVKSKGVPQDVLDAVFEMDPTSKKSYTRWVLMQWDSSKESILKAINNGSLKRLFDYVKQRAGSGLDLARMKSFDEALSFLPDVDPVLEKEGDPSSPENNFDIVYESPEWVIAVPHTYEADKKLGRGCKWCTAGAYGDDDGYWRRYTAYGPLWVNFDKRGSEICPMDNKEYPYKRYQFLFEWQNWEGELMDCRDNRICFEEMDMPEKVLEFYESQNERYREVLENSDEVDDETAMETMNEDRWEHSHLVKEVDGSYLSLLPEEPNDYRHYNFDDCCYYLYDEEDISDPIAWTEYDPNTFMVEAWGNYPFAIVKSASGKINAVRLGSYWEEVGNIDSYGTLNNIGPYFVDDTLLYFCSEEDTRDYAEIELNQPCKEALSPYIDTRNLPDEYAFNGDMKYNEGDWIETVNMDGSHSLYFFHWPSREAITFIMKDVPVNGTCFELEMIEGKNGFIEGEMGKHYLVDNESSNDGFTYDILGCVDEERGYYMVRNYDGYYNIYDYKNRKLIFDEWYEQIQLMRSESGIEYYQCGSPGKKFLYDLKNNKLLTPIFNDLRMGGSHYMRLWIGSADKADYVYTEDLRFIGKFGNFMGVANSHIIIVMNVGSNDIHTFNINDGTVGLPDNVKSYGVIGNGGYPIILFRCGEGKSGEIRAYNIETDKIFDGDIVAMPKTIATFDENSGVWACKYKDGLYNLINENGEHLLSEGALSVTPLDAKAMAFIEYKDRYTFVKLSKDNPVITLPTKYGISKKYAELYASWNGRTRFTLTPEATGDNSGAEFEYNYEENKVQRVLPAEEKYEIIANKVVFPEISQISENFKNMYKRILDPIK